MTDWLIEALSASSMLMILVLLVRRPIANRFGPRWAYLLWTMPALRMLLPSLSGPTPTMKMVGFEVEGLGPVVVHPIPLVPAVAPLLPAAPSAAIPWGNLLLAVWLGGALLYFAWQIAAYHLFLRRALARSTFLSRDCGISVLSSDAVEGPIAAGIVRRYILLPRDFTTRYDREERKLALAHEVAHHVRGDLVANLGALALLALHWFNPVAHLAYRAFRADQELACDRTVLADASAAERFSYGSAIVKSAWGVTPAAACALNRTSQIKRRLKMMTKGRTSLLRGLSGGALVVVLAGSGLLLTASHGSAAEAAKAIVPVILVRNAQSAEPTEDAAAAEQAAEPRAAVSAEAALASADEARAAHDDARRLAGEARVAAADAEAIAAQAQATAHATLANIDIAGIIRTSLAAARAGLAEGCANADLARRTAAEGSDTVAIATLAAGCVDQAAIRRQVAGALREARSEIARESELSALQRRQALSTIDAELARIDRESH